MSIKTGDAAAEAPSVEGSSEPQAARGPVLSAVAPPSEAPSYTIYAILGLVGVLLFAALIFMQWMEVGSYDNAFMPADASAVSAPAPVSAVPTTTVPPAAPAPAAAAEAPAAPAGAPSAAKAEAATAAAVPAAAASAPGEGK